MLGSVKRLRDHGTSRRADKIIHHPRLQWTGIGPIYYDVALVHLEKPVNFDNYILPICLPKPDFSSLTNCYIIGWGYIGHNQGEFKVIITNYLKLIKIMLLRGGVRGYGVYGTFNNISVMSWRSLLVVEETAVTGHWQTLSHNVVQVYLVMSGIQTYNFSSERN